MILLDKKNVIIKKPSNIGYDLLGILSHKDIEDFKRMNKYNENQRKYSKKKSKYQRKYSKKKSKCRNNDLDPESSIGIGYITEVLVSKFLGIPTCFEITNNFHYPMYDILEHEDYGKINVKGSTLRTNCKRSYWEFKTKNNKEIDFFFCIGYDLYRENVVAVYYIPNDNNFIDTTIYINTDWISDMSIYHWFRQDAKPWNDLFHSLKLENCPILRNY